METCVDTSASLGADDPCVSAASISVQHPEQFHALVAALDVGAGGSGSLHRASRVVDSSADRGEPSKASYRKLSPRSLALDDLDQGPVERCNVGDGICREHDRMAG